MLTLSNIEQGATIKWEKSIDNINYHVIQGETQSTLVDVMSLSDSYYRAVTSTSTCSQLSNIVDIIPDTCFVSEGVTSLGASSTQNYIFNGYYKYNWSNVIYTANDLGLSKGKLASVFFDVANSPSNFTMSNQKIYVRQTLETEHIDASYPTTTGFTLVEGNSF